MSGILDTFESKKSRFSKSIKFILAYSVAVMVVVLAGVYIGNLLFGSRSLDVMLDLYNQEETLKLSVKKLQEANSALQKEYFELVGLDPDNYK